jgi:hypothetical protein
LIHFISFLFTYSKYERLFASKQALSLTPYGNYAIITYNDQDERSSRMEQFEQQKSTNTFFTETDIFYAKGQAYKASFIIYIVLAALASLGLLISKRTFLYFELFVFIIILFTVYVNQKNIHDYRLRFENDMLCITDRTTGESFWVYDTPASDFLITQTAKEKKRNYCSVAIKHTVFILSGVKNCTELKKYISENYPSFEN